MATTTTSPIIRPLAAPVPVLTAFNSKILPPFNPVLDRVRGMFAGHFLGDALGAPHEFGVNTPYTGLLQQVPFMNSRWQGRKELAVGQVTDDTEMTLALLRTMITNHGYNSNEVLKAYLGWANSDGWMIGKNTSAMFRGVTTPGGHSKRIQLALVAPEEQRSQSNGALMRCSPLALLRNKQIVAKAVAQDVWLSNPVNICSDVNMIYVAALQLALHGIPRNQIFVYLQLLPKNPRIKEVFDQVASRTESDIVHQKGWCLHALWISLIVLTSNLNYQDAMRAIITQPGSDTDTNAAIAGALLGACLGFDALQKEKLTGQNIPILLNTAAQVAAGNSPTPRPAAYQPADFWQLTEAAYRLTLI